MERARVITDRRGLQDLLGSRWKALWRLRSSRGVQSAAIWLSYVAAAAVVEGRSLPPACPWRLVSGHRCPFCGLTTSVGRLVKGHRQEAREAHPLGVFLFVGSGLWIARRLLEDICHDRTAEPPDRPTTNRYNGAGAVSAGEQCRHGGAATREGEEEMS